MKTPDCVEMKNTIQADILRDLGATPKAEPLASWVNPESMS